MQHPDDPAVTGGPLLKEVGSAFLFQGILAQLLKPFGIFCLPPKFACLQKLSCVGSCLINHCLHAGCRGTHGERLPRDLQPLSERAFPNSQLRPSSQLWQKEHLV